MFREELNISNTGFDSDFSNFLLKKETIDKNIISSVSEIIKDVSIRGDEALIDLTEKLDNHLIDNFFISEDEINASYRKINKEVISALEFSFNNIIKFHSKCRDSLNLESVDSEVSRVFKPIRSALLYVPGGKASYPSSVLMAAGPAIASQVKDLYLTTPCVGGQVNDLTVAAAKVAGIKNIARLGGAQSIAAFSFGTKSIPKVDKIVGPGNSYVAEAKRQLFGRVGIDSIAGPSEIVILANETSSPEIVAWDLMAQAEHDEDASSILISNSREIIQKVKEIIENECPNLERARIIQSSLKNNGLILKIDNLKQAIYLINRLAPEHLHLAFDNQEIDINDLVAGIILEGTDSAVSLSDYVLGPSHILPTNASSRFSSPLSVEDFMISSSKVAIKSESNKDLYNELVDKTSVIARAEGLTAHAISVEKRKKD
ncbi:MAG TPA: histidinol dehydrogenase [SAR86 cluster bacterium]|jgi:histidinol dehydrogenase|nr:histidinol dehydrogenase [SAR86 cluster bacterium]HJM15318.1 histidinol dehydrogenase [SAR86 cluster bacterium]